ncbi:unnamed protein product [Symbiodinium sp. CCMP2456]|nr:unnamed protein product [Symbiodinium sp. CCMP2456]
MVTIGTSTSITWQDRRVVVPDELLVEIGEAKYLKIQPSHRIMMKLLLGSRTAGSLTSSPGLMKLKEARDEAIAEALKKEKGSGADDLFPDAKKKKVKVTFPTVDFVIVDGLQMGDADPDEKRIYKRRKVAQNRAASEESKQDSD